MSQSSAKVGSITTITVSQTQQSATTAMFTLVNDGTNAHWTFQTTGAAADAFMRPFSTTTAGLGTDQLNNVESLAIYLQSSVAIATGGVTISTPLEIALVGLP